MKASLQKTSTLFGILALSLLSSFGYLSIKLWVDPLVAKSKLVGEVQALWESRRTHYLNTIESFVHKRNLPFSAKDIAEQIQDVLDLGFVNIYDERLKLIYSTASNPSVFQNELRNDRREIPKGQITQLADGNLIYYEKQGRYFFEFPNPKSIESKISNPNLEMGFLFWVVDPKQNEILFSNDDSVLTMDRTEKELLNLFRGNEGKEISWSIDRKTRVLEKIDIEEGFIYLLEEKLYLDRTVYYTSFVVLLVVFFTLFYAHLFVIDYKIASIQIRKKLLLGCLVFLVTLSFYHLSLSLFPNYRYYKPWMEKRFQELETLFLNLEKNISPEQSEDGFQMNQNLIREVYVWRTNELNQSILFRFGTEIQNSIEKAIETKSTLFLEANFDLVMIVPKMGTDSKQSTVLVAVIQSDRLHAKKDRGLDEFFFPSVFTVLSENKSKELVRENPQVWKESNFHLNQKQLHGKLSYLGETYSSYLYINPKNWPSFFRGLYVLKAETKSPYLFTFGLFSFLPLFAFWLIRKKKEQNSEEVVQPTEIKNNPEILNIPKEGIESKSKDDKIKPTEVKKNLQYIPPVSWKKPKVFDPIQKKRESIFNPELKALVEKVSTPPEANIPDSIPTDTDEFWKIPEERKFEYSLLDRIYRNDGISLDGIVNYTQNFISRFGSPRFSYLFLNEELGSYHSQISSGLDYNTRSNLIFVHHDPYLQFDESGFAMFDLTEDVRLDRFISKKFSWEILIQTETVVAFLMDSLGFSGIFMVLLTKEEKLKFLSSHKRMILDKLKQVIPALHMLVHKEDSKPTYLEDNLSWMVRSFLQATFGGKRQANVLRIRWPEYRPTQENNIIKQGFIDKIECYMSHKDRIIETSPGSLVIVTEKDLYLKILGHLESLPFENELVVKKFPDDGQNYYLYL